MSDFFFLSNWQHSLPLNAIVGDAVPMCCVSSNVCSINWLCIHSTARASSIRICVAHKDIQNKKHMIMWLVLFTIHSRVRRYYFHSSMSVLCVETQTSSVHYQWQEKMKINEREEKKNQNTQYQYQVFLFFFLSFKRATFHIFSW